MKISYRIIKLFLHLFYRMRKPHIKDSMPIKINIVTTWNERCGIAYYSAFLASELIKKNVELYVTPISKVRTIDPVYSFTLGFKAGRLCDVVHVQFGYGIFADFKIGRVSFPCFAAFSFYMGLTLGIS